jgi:transcriptional repressor NrdR
MQCPYCLNQKSRVVDKRNIADLRAIRRRRECLACRRRFTTYERATLGNIQVQKKDGRLEPFSREKLVAGFLKACEKRPVSAKRIDKAVDEIEAEIRAADVAVVPTNIVGTLVTERLKTLDKIAYVRFVSVYREFRDLRSFESEIRRLKQAH